MAQFESIDYSTLLLEKSVPKFIWYWLFILITFLVTVGLFISCYVYTPYDTLIGMVNEKKMTLLLNENQIGRLQEGLFIMENLTYQTNHLEFKIEGTEIVEDVPYYRVSFPVELALENHYTVIQWQFPKPTLLKNWQKRKRGWFI